MSIDIPELLMVDSGCPVQGGGKGRLTNVKTIDKIFG